MSISKEKHSAFEIKNSSLSVLEFKLFNTDISAIKQQLEQQFSSENNFFDQETIILNTIWLENALLNQADADQLELQQLIPLLQAINLRPVAALVKSDYYRQQAQSANLLLIDELDLRHKKTPAPQPVAVAATPSSSMIIDKPVRAGQRIYAPNTDLIVLAMVNKGAEIIADGNIHVYAPLRGRVIAGASGNRAARIFATQMDADLVSIAGIYRTSEEPIPHNLQNKPVQIQLQNETLIFSPL